MLGKGLKRPSVRIAFLSVLVPALTLLVAAAVSPFGQGARNGAGLLLLPILLAPFIAALAYVVPARYLTNPRFERMDIGLGSMTLGELVLLVLCPLLVFLAVDGQSPSPPLFVGAGIVAGLGAGAINEKARRRFPDAWKPRLWADRPLAIGSKGDGDVNVTIRPTRATRGIVAVFMGALGLLIVYTEVRNSTMGPEIVLLIVFVGFIAFILWISAGCDQERVWFAWRRVPRSELREMELQRRPSLGADYGAIRLFDSEGEFALAIPTLFFADDDIDSLVGAIGLPQRPQQTRVTGRRLNATCPVTKNMKATKKANRLWDD